MHPLTPTQSPRTTRVFILRHNSLMRRVQLNGAYLAHKSHIDNNNSNDDGVRYWQLGAHAPELQHLGH